MRVRQLSVLLLAAVMMTACSSRRMVKPSPQAIDQYIQNHPDLPEYDKACIYDGRFEIGIRQSTLQFLLGEPKEKIVLQQPWGVQEKWIYNRRGQQIFIIEDKHVVGILEE